MTNAPEEELFYLGSIVRVHGLDGTLKAVLETDEPHRYAKVRWLWVRRSSEWECKETAKIQICDGRSALVRFKAFPNSADTARPYIGATIHLPVKFLPPLPPGAFYYHDVIGFDLCDERLGRIGTVLNVVENPAHDLIVFAHGYKQRFLPVVDEFVLGADMDARIVRVRLPDGLLEL
ncbi:MAG: ribosome maturation factor RimM [Bacteroidia bacterium]|nr:ribosome maturation factor RimM [Bacteroidia bacterium]MDW8334823.1 ribosome maturation factor RimM [Bacteroidia bacterium]